MREILVEGPSRAANGQVTGRTSQNRVVNFDGSKGLIGETIYVKIIAAFSHSLKGEPRLLQVGPRDPSGILGELLERSGFRFSGVRAGGEP